VTANIASAYIVGSQTLVPGGGAIIVSGTTLSVDPAGSTLVIDGSITQQLYPTATPSTLVIGSHTLTANFVGQFIYGSQTLIPGGTPITIDGVAISFPAAAPSTIVVGSHTLTMNSVGQFIDGTQTLVPGGLPIVIDGTVISLPPSATAPVTISAPTAQLGPNDPDSSRLAELILKGFGYLADPASTTTTLPQNSNHGSSTSSGIRAAAATNTEDIRHDKKPSRASRSPIPCSWTLIAVTVAGLIVGWGAVGI
jgi:hypothetical protein